MRETPSGRRSNGAPTGLFTAHSFSSGVFHGSLVIIAALTVAAVGGILGLDTTEAAAIIMILLVVSFVALMVLSTRNEKWKHPVRAARLAAIAHAHGLDYVTVSPVPSMLWGVFGSRSSTQIRESMSGPDSALVMGTLFDADLKSGRTFDDLRGFLALRLTRRLPNIVLESRRSTFSFVDTAVSGSPTATQRLSLEGDFDSHFTLYCPAGYERDALYIFTPDLMALLIDETGDVSVQLVDDLMVFTSTEPFDLTDAALVRRLLDIAEVVGSKTLRQTKRYSDGRSDVVDAVAAPGARLTRARPTALQRLGWYSLRTLLGSTIGVIFIVGRLGVDPTRWVANSIAWWS